MNTNKCVQFSFDWDISLLDLNRNIQSKHYSPDFKCVHRSVGFIWNLIFFNYPMSKGDFKRIVFLFYKAGDKPIVKAGYSLALVEFNKRHAQFTSMSDEFSCRSTRGFVRGKEELWAEFWLNLPVLVCNKTDKTFINDDNCVTIRCKLIIDEDEFNACISTPVLPQSSMVKSDRIVGKKLFNSVLNESSEETYADVVLISSDQKIFKCHKNILSVGCNVFATMFRTDMLESKSNIVNIDDIDSDTLTELLRYIYTNEIVNENVNCAAWNLVYAADKYELTELKKRCELIMINTISKTNAVKFFLIGDRHNLNIVKTKAISIIVDHFSQIKSQSDWKMLLTTSPEAVMTILDDATSRANVSVKI